MGVGEDDGRCHSVGGRVFEEVPEHPAVGLDGASGAGSVALLDEEGVEGLVPARLFGRQGRQVRIQWWDSV